MKGLGFLLPLRFPGFRFQPQPGPAASLHPLPPSFPPLPPSVSSLPPPSRSPSGLHFPSFPALTHRPSRRAPAALPAGSCSSVAAAPRPEQRREAARCPGYPGHGGGGSVRGERRAGAADRALRGGRSGAAVSCGAGSRRSPSRRASGLRLGCESCRAKRSVLAVGLRNNLVFFPSRLQSIVSNCPRMCLQLLKNDLRPLLAVVLPCGFRWVSPLPLRAPSRYRWKPKS